MRNSTGLLWAFILVVIIGLGAYAILYTHPSLTEFATSTPSGASNPTGGTGASSAVTFYCDQGQINATFSKSAVQLSLSDKRYFVLPQVQSGSGIRYEATVSGKDELFQSKGSWAELSENGTATYANCVAAHVTDAGGGFKTYLDQNGLFTFKYPNSFSIVGTAPGYTQSWMVNATTSGMLLAEVQLPASYEPKTNFAGANFSVGVGSDPSALATCLSYNPSGAQGSGPVPVKVGGITFDKFTSSDAGAGNFYNTTSYRLIRDGECYALEYTIHSTNINNYPKGAVTAFNQAQVQTLLAGIVATFQFVQ